jgi:hypothetical protein
LGELTETKPGEVLKETKQPGETHPVKWDWVGHSIWTERMLEALEKGVRGGVWFSLIDHQRWPNQFFRDNGLFSLVNAHASLLQSSRR